jgi:acyl carrier protein
LTEATPIASTPLPPQKRKPGSVGCLIGPDVAVMNSVNTILPLGEKGEIVVRGLNVMKGYENNEEANEQAFSGDWFKTGDEGYIDGEFLYLTGRIKEIINRGGQKVSPREVDEVLIGHPGVAEAAVFAIPHISLTESVAAAVVPEKGHEISEKMLRQYVAERIAFYKVPQHIIFVDNIPKGPTGKINRKLLSQSFSHLLRPEYVMLETETEVKVGMIWKELLHVDRIGRNDNFIALGGNSLLGTQVISRLNKVFHINIPLRNLFEMPTAAELAKFIDEVHHVVEETQRSMHEIPRNYEVGHV